MRLKWLGHVLVGVTDDQKCTSVEANEEKIKRTTEQKLDGLY